MLNTAVIIPTRLHSQRLPHKPLQTIGEYSLIEHVVLNVYKKIQCNVYLATDSESIADAVAKHSVPVIITPELPSGTDRVHHAIQQIDPQRNIQYVVNLQGDMPFIEPDLINQMLHQLHQTECDILTLARKGECVMQKQQFVKIISDAYNRALYFSRNDIPYGAQQFLYHTGIYGFTRSALERFVALPPSNLETIENLEQLRAIEHGMHVSLMHHYQEVISVDTQEDLENAREFWRKTQQSSPATNLAHSNV
ncbi:3-deoxy-manno-octulosonate cytidylyltransferase [Rickettsiales endosymbiont of Paramecium tredecaurelia]|uniref:3-deoxy-manno-octulosonate cytidylyltransferase family protein n=1 Tax=Candidatus Sarmatiella mevalonica TaxID=2770581 RepID=UPI0019231421|nr:manno-octulosonate cytidylyltransferase [Candidatus Sarmatiella mevalonica]MBL3284307.1 3-deoxy-manno-octulosonate cytidylyltransferase [Candidatus Sarmatiella mevalonica]